MKSRLISAAIMILIFVPILIIGGLPFRIAMGVIAILAYREILNLKGINKYPKIVELLGLFTILMNTFSNRDILYSSIGLDYKYIVASFLLMFMPTLFYHEKGNYTTKEAFELTSFIMFLGIVLNLASNILIYEKIYFIMIILITVLTDTFAYIVGKMIGRHTFTKISPNKTVEGCLGGIIMGSILTSIFYATFIDVKPLTTVIPVIIVLTIVCEIGDLFYSAIKRERGIKDFSNLIPGHGGVLDRIDSITFVILAFVLLKNLI
ncbi:MAG: phosphatidate cytidylyltransferase [Bacilli bacterium]|nr:phosphatidate cytidylyltransferase [Bacilli bacterium]